MYPNLVINPPASEVSREVVNTYRKEVMQVRTRKHDINDQYLYDNILKIRLHKVQFSNGGALAMAININCFVTFLSLFTLGK